MDGFEKRAKRKKKQILDAAFELFLLHGVRGTTIQMIAKKAQVSQVTIYNYYQSKENVLIEIATDIFEKYTKGFEDIIYDSSLSFDQKIEAWLEFGTLIIDELSIDLIIALFDNQNKRMQKLKGWYLQNRISTAIEYLIREGKNENRILRNLDSDSVLLFMDLFKGIANKEQRHDKYRFKDLIYLFFYGLGGKQ